MGYKEIPDWAAERGIATASESTFERAVGPVRETSPLKKPRGRPGTRAPKKAALVRDWILVDEAALGVRKVIYRLRNDGVPQPELRAAIVELIGIRQVIETSSDREIIAIALVRDEDDARDLRARLEELAPGHAVRMDAVEWEDHLPARRTWLRLAETE